MGLYAGPGAESTTATRAACELLSLAGRRNVNRASADIESHEARPTDIKRGWVTGIVTAVGVGLILVLLLAPAGTATPHHATFPAGGGEDVPLADPDLPGAFTVPPPPFKSEEVLDSLEESGKPCSNCHNEEMEVNRERRELMTHGEIVLKHDEKHRWCLDCHDADNRDKLRLASGVLVDFSESYRLCGQCHGDKYRDWRQGIHGRRTGEWNGKKEYLLCVHCHYSHAPKFKPLEPKPPPQRPGDIR